MCHYKSLRKTNDFWFCKCCTDYNEDLKNVSSYYIEKIVM